MIELIAFISNLLTLYIYVLIASAVISWLVAFNVINTRNYAVYSVVRTINALTEPVNRYFRQFIPTVGGLDMASLVVFLILYFIKDVILPNILKIFILY